MRAGEYSLLERYDMRTKSERYDMRTKIQQAVLESQHYNSIVKIPWAQEAEDELTFLCENCVPECGEFWGEDWRVHLIREV